MKNLKKIISCALMAATLFSTAVFAEENEEYDKFETVLNYAANLYIDESVTASDIIDSALKGVLKDNPELMNKMIKEGFKSLDKYTEYYTPEEYELFKKNIDSVVYGIGVLIQQVDDYITVMSVMDGGGAKEAGILPGDKISKVDGVDVKGETVDKVQDMVVGEIGTDVTVTFIRGEREFDCTITRREVKSATVSGEILPGNIGYIVISSFASDTAKEFNDVLYDFDTKGVKNIILDLRDNPGGYLDAAIDIARMIVPKGIIVSTVYRSEWENEVLYSELENPKYAFAVLVNENTASAAEVLSSAVQDSEVGVLIGHKTYGKGVIQEMFNAWDGCGFKITTGRYFTRNGKDINGGGITPDISITNPTRKIDLSRYTTFDYKTKQSVGDVSDNVKAAKERLGLLGYYQGGVTENFDESLYKAVYDFQAENELFPYGVLDISTQVKIENIFYKLDEVIDNQFYTAYEHFGGNKEDLLNNNK